MIVFPAKTWSPKVVSEYTTPNLDNKDVDDILDYDQCGKFLYKPELDWSDDSKRQDIIVYNENDHAAELAKDLRFDKSVYKDTCAAVTSIIIEFWDYFFNKGVKRTVLG